MKALAAAILAILVVAMFLMFPVAWMGDSYSGPQTRQQFQKSRDLVLGYPHRHPALNMRAEQVAGGGVELRCDGTPLLNLWHRPDGKAHLSVAEGAEWRAPGIDVLTRELTSRLGATYKGDIARSRYPREATNAFVLKLRDGIDFSKACSLNPQRG